MRSAEEWIKFAKSQPDEMQTKWATETIPYGDLLLMIREAQREAIIECAEVAESLPGGNHEAYGPVDKQSILNLLNNIQ